MRTATYSRWDGTQDEFSLDPDKALDALSDLLMEGLDVREALEWMRRHGFEMAGMDMRVMGVEELINELRDEAQSLYDRYDMDGALDEISRRFDEILDREQRALEQAHGYESSRMNDFQQRRHAELPELSDSIEQFRNYRFEDEQAGEDFQELLDELDRQRQLEKFLEQRGERFGGSEQADYETAQQVRERIEGIEQLARDLAQGNFEQITPEQLQEMLGDEAAQSFILLRDLGSSLERRGYLRQSGDELTPRAIRKIGANALAAVYGALRKDRLGGHETDARGAAIPRPDETKPFEFGDPLDLDVVRTMMNGVRRMSAVDSGPGTGGAVALDLDVADFEIREFDYTTQTTTVLLLDMSWSMSWAGRFPAAKRVALALDHLIRTKFPRDKFFVVGFSTRARELPVKELPEVSWDLGDPFTNLQDGLRVAERLIAQHPCSSPQILVITDGQPTAYFEGNELRVEWPSGFGGVSPRAVVATMNQVRRVTRRGITINTFMLDDAPELVGFVDHMTQINRGRALFSSPTELGSFVMFDYLDGRKKRNAG
jgi:uncharacterized protein with von Willebrand factor type A (vWA) domain